jgi:transcription antitermination factor NusA-like protein
MLTLKDNSGKYLETLNSWVLGEDIKSEDIIQIESSYVILGNITNSLELVANYNLIILGDLFVDKIHIKKDLFVLGNIKTNDLIVGGNLNCKSDINCKTAKVGRSLAAKSFQINTANIGWNLTVDSSFVEESLVVENEIICLEGIAGSGVCKAKNILIKEYKHIRTEFEQEIILSEGFNPVTVPSRENNSDIEGLMVKELFEKESIMDNYNELQSKLNNFLIDNFESYISDIEERYDFDEIDKKFYIIQKKIPSLGGYIENFKQIIKFGDTKGINSVEDFIALLNLKHSTPKFFYKISIVSDVLLSFYNLQKDNLERLKIQYTAKDMVIHNLYFLNQRRYLLSNEDYQILFNKLISCLTISNTNSNNNMNENSSSDDLLKNIINIVPEIKNGKVEIKSISRDEGVRSKVAVVSTDNSIDPVGCCVGYKGERIQKLSDSLSGEKVDIILWSPNPEEFIKNALSPANALFVEIHENSAIVEVASDQYTAAVGKKGINTKLASNLTGYRISVSMK